MVTSAYHMQEEVRGLSITMIADRDEVFVACEYINDYAFKNGALGVEYALLPVICAGFGLSQDNCAHLSRIGCLSPHNCCA